MRESSKELNVRTEEKTKSKISKKMTLENDKNDKEVE